MASFSPEKPLHRKKKHIVLLPFAAALILILGITAYAVWSIHITRQQELKTDLEIEENHVSSYREYELPKEQEDGLVLLSSVNEGQWQRIYMDISPVTEEEAVGISKGEVLCSCRIKETDIVCNAEPKMPVGVELSGKDEIQKAAGKFLEREQVAKPTYTNLDGDDTPRTVIKKAKVGRNDPCPCGSGKKYKNCCGRNK